METISSGINLQIYRDVNFYRKKKLVIFATDFYKWIQALKY